MYKTCTLISTPDFRWSIVNKLSLIMMFLLALLITNRNFYQNGIGVKANPDAALYWCRLAYRAGDRSVANNIGCIVRDRKKFGQAIEWFRRAVQQKDGDANLNIAKIYLHKGDLVKTRSHLDKTRRSPWATEQSKEEARSLLRKMKSESRKSTI
jgi:TPR repeat protein